MTTQKPQKERRAQILDAALSLAAADGYTRLTRDRVARLAAISPALVSRRWSTMAQLKRAVMREAIRQAGAIVAPSHGVLSIIAQGIALGDPEARRAPEAVQTAALAAIAPQK